MISVISPAKTLCYDNNVNQSFSYPEFLNKSKKLIEILSKMKVNELSALMKTSEKISELNYQRFKNWNAKFDLNNSKQSIFVFEKLIKNCYFNRMKTSIIFLTKKSMFFFFNENNICLCF